MFKLKDLVRTSTGVEGSIVEIKYRWSSALALYTVETSNGHTVECWEGEMVLLFRPHEVTLRGISGWTVPEGMSFKMGDSPEEDNRKLVTHCAYCGEELFEQDRVVVLDGMIYCDLDCLHKATEDRASIVRLPEIED